MRRGTAVLVVLLLIAAGGLVLGGTSLAQDLFATPNLYVDGPHSVNSGSSNNFSSYIDPPLGQLPRTVTWAVTGFSDTIHVNRGYSDTLAIGWNTSGEKTIVVTSCASFGGSCITSTVFSVFVYPAPQTISWASSFQEVMESAGSATITLTPGRAVQWFEPPIEAWVRSDDPIFGSHSFVLTTTTTIPIVFFEDGIVADRYLHYWIEEVSGATAVPPITTTLKLRDDLLTPSPTPSVTRTRTATPIFTTTPTATRTYTPTPTEAAIPTEVGTETLTPTPTANPSWVYFPIVVLEPTETPTLTPTPSATLTFTPVPTSTSTPTPKRK